MKKKLHFLAAVVLITTALFSEKAQAQAPQTLTYQSVLRNSSNVLMSNTMVGTKISILQGAANGNAVYAETQTATTNLNGLMSLQIGSGNPLIGTFSAINWANGPYFIKTETDPNGGSTYTIIGTQQMASVPYALYASKSGDAVFGVTEDNENDIHNTNSGNVGIGTDLPHEKLDVAGNLSVRQNATVSGDLNVGNEIKISGGNPSMGKVLTSDNDGRATWAYPVVQDLSGYATNADLNNLQNQMDDNQMQTQIQLMNTSLSLQNQLSTSTNNLNNQINENQIDTDANLATKEDLINKNANVNLGTSDTFYPTQKAVKTYVDTNVSTLNQQLQTQIVTNQAQNTLAQSQLETQIGVNQAQNSQTQSQLSTQIAANQTQTQSQIIATQIGLEGQINTATTQLQSQIDTNQAQTQSQIMQTQMQLEDQIAINQTQTQANLATKENLINKSADVNLGTSDALYPTQKATKAYVDSNISTSNQQLQTQIATNQTQNLEVQSQLTTQIAGNQAQNLQSQMQLEDQIGINQSQNLTTQTQLSNQIITNQAQNLQAQIDLDTQIDANQAQNLTTQTQLSNQIVTNQAQNLQTQTQLSNQIVTNQSQNLQAQMDLDTQIDVNQVQTQANLATKEDLINKSTDANLGTSDTLYPTQKATKAYVDSNISTSNQLLQTQIVTNQAQNLQTQYHLTNQVATNQLQTQVDLATKENTSNKSNDPSLFVENANEKFPTVEATKTYVDAKVAAIPSLFEVTQDIGDAIYNTNLGNVGIGTDLPSEKLDVAGNLRVRQNEIVAGNSMVQGNSMIGQNLEVNGLAYIYSLTIPSGNPAQGKVLTSDSNGTATWQTPAALSTVFEPTFDMPDAIHNTNSGNVGIGTDLPSAKLDIAGDIRIRGGNPAQGKVLTSDENGTATWQTPASADLTGYATSTDVYNLQIDVINNQMQTDNLMAQTSYLQNQVLDNQSALTTKEDTINKSIDINLGTSDILFPTQNATKTYVDNRLATMSTVFETTADDATAIHNTNAGNVGIGTDLPSAKLDVNGNLKVRNNATVNGTLGIRTIDPITNFQLNDKVVDDGQFTYDANTAYLVHPTPTSSTVLNDPKTSLLLARQGTNGEAYGAGAAFNLSRYEDNGVGSRTRLDLNLANENFMQNATNVMTLLSNGNVGIGTDLPSEKLDVVGNIKSSGTYSGTGITTTTGADYGGVIIGVNGGYNISNFGVAVAGIAYGGGIPPAGRDIGVYGTSVDAAVYSNGPLVVTDGSQGLGKVLTSDADGKASWQTPTPAPTVTLGAIGTSSNANGAAIAAGVLNLQPANANFGGVVTTATQTLAGAKTFTNSLKVDSGTAGGATLQVNGAATNTTAFNAVASLTIDFTKSNLAYTTASAGAFTLSGMKDGGTYTLAVQGATAGTASFSQTGFTFKSISNGATTASKHTIYTFLVLGNVVYFSMATGF